MAVARCPAGAAFEQSLISRCRGSVLSAIAEAPGAEIGDLQACRRELESSISAGGCVCVLRAIVERLAETAIERGPLDGRDPGPGQFSEARLEITRGDGALQPPGILRSLKIVVHNRGTLYLTGSSLLTKPKVDALSNIHHFRQKQVVYSSFRRPLMDF
ncbi:MAG TPA: hypothetical protein VGI28_04980 [Stellaceae bacterium]